MNIANNRRALSVILPLLLLVVVGSLAVGAIMLTQSASKTSGDIIETTRSFYSANSGLEWLKEVTKDYTTTDRGKWKALDGASYEIAGSGGSRFTLGVAYVDSDGTPDTEDSVTIISTGSVGELATSSITREVRVTLPVPVARANGSFSDSFDDPDTTLFDGQYLFGQAVSAHGYMTPYTTALAEAEGDISDLFTYPSEPGGLPSVLRMGGAGEVRLTINIGSCFKWSKSGLPANCDYSACQSINGCEAKTGFNLQADPSGFQNYFIKIRGRLIAGDGFGIYFRAGYQNHYDPYNVDFGTLTAYIWQYDKGLGYLLPCDRQSAIAGNNGMGMLVTRRVAQGSETCGADCAIFESQADPATYPFFCPENDSNLTILPGWRFREADWLISWRTIYIYIYHSRANIYVGREEIAGNGGEPMPVHVGEVDLSQVGSPLTTGDVGLRTWNGSVVDIDYINIYPNDDDNDPTSFSGG